jgi:hypothetical protein
VQADAADEAGSGFYVHDFRYSEVGSMVSFCGLPCGLAKLIHMAAGRVQIAFGDG